MTTPSRRSTDPLVSRRHLLALVGTSGVGVLVAACAGRPSSSGGATPAAASSGASSGLSPSAPVAGVPAVAPARGVDGGGAAAVAAAVPTVLPPTATQSVPLLNGVAPDATATPAATATTVATTGPSVTPTATPLAYDPARLKDKLGSAQTSYAGSIPERAWNVELAAKRLDGAKVPPGGIFSFNQAVGPTTLKAGFRIGYGITMSDDKPETVPSVAGGICQVATTVFQAAFWAGFPFVERHYHLYWIARYGVPPSGRVGMDATVDDPGVDLKFKNTSSDWIRLDSWFDGSNIGFVIYGVDPGWTVEVAKPKIFDVVKTTQTMVKQDDPTMPPGRELLVEHAEDGFSVTVTRLIKMNGKTLDELTYTNKYLPSRNVMLVGTKGLTPKPTASTTGTPVGTGTPQATASPLASATVTPARPATTPPAAPSTTAQAPPGQVKVPSLVGLPEAQARKLIQDAGLNNTYPNYQGPGQVPQQVLQSVAVGSVLSQTPSAGASVAPGSTIYLAVRRA